VTGLRGDHPTQFLTVQPTLRLINVNRPEWIHMLFALVKVV